MSRISSKLKKAVKERAHFCCEYCKSQEEFSPQSFSIEHIIPVVKKGENIEANLALSCQGCNNHKSYKTTGFDVVTNSEVQLYHPRIHNWENHFTWNEVDYCYSQNKWQ